MDAVRVEDVSKTFVLRNVERGAATLKAALTDMVRGRRAAPPVHRALQDVSFAVGAGETFGFIGRNGSGKSTLLRLVAGIYRPDAGRVWTRGRVASLLDLGAGFHHDFTGRENVFVEGTILGLSRRQIARRLESIVEFAELGEYVDQPLRTYSSGMFMRLAFAVAIHVDPDVLLVDEVFAVGDEAFVAKCQERIERFRAAGGTILLVSHDLSSIARWCERTLWLHEGRVRAIGPSGEVTRAYHEAFAATAAACP